VLAALLGLFAPAVAPAQTNAISDSRYLLIFDTSAAMKRRSDNVQRMVGELIASGMNGQMRGGDTIGVWTFNDALYAGHLPLTRWTTERRMSIAAKVTEFLRGQKFEKEAHFDTVLPSLQRVVTNSAKLTVLLFSDGISTLSGTPFDGQIAAAYEPFRENQKRERMPFVTVLRAKNGEYLGYGVTPAPWAVEFPKFPPEPVVVVARPEPKPAPPRPTVPPLIVIGKKDTNAAPTVELPQPGTGPKPTPKSTMTEAEKLFARLAAEQGLTEEAAENTNAAGLKSPGEIAPPNAAPAENAKPTPTAPPDATEVPKAPAPPPVTNNGPQKTMVAAAAATVVSNPPPMETKPAPAVQAVAVPVDEHSSRILLLAAGTSVLVVALGVGYALMRRRQRVHVSLITSSMDRGRK
jgi:hypothetical protein